MNIEDIKRGDIVYFRYDDDDCTIVKVKYIADSYSNITGSKRIHGDICSYINFYELPTTERLLDLYDFNNDDYIVIHPRDFDNLHFLFDDNISRYKRRLNNATV